MSEMTAEELKPVVQEMKELMGTLAKETHEAQDSYKRQLKESGDVWAEKATETIDKLNALSDRQEKQEKALLELETLAARPTTGATVEDKKDEAVQRKAFSDYIRKGNFTNSDLINVMEISAARGWRKDLVGQSNYGDEKLYTKDVLEGILPDGGFLIQPYDYVADRIKRIFETSPMRSICRVRPTNSPLVIQDIDDQQTGEPSQVQEIGTVPTTATPKVGQVTIGVFNISEILPISTQMLQDAGFDVTAWLIDHGTNKVMRKQNTTYVVGTGNDEARGLLSYPTWGGTATTIGLSTGFYQTGALQHIFGSTVKAGDPAATGLITYRGIVNTWGALVDPYNNNAKWLMHRTTFPLILQILDDNDRPLFNFQNLLQVGAKNAPLMGERVIFANDMPPADPSTGLFDAGLQAVAYGDFMSGYQIVDRTGMQILRDPFTKKDKHRVEFMLDTRTGGALASYDALKMLEIGAA